MRQLLDKSRVLLLVSSATSMPLLQLGRHKTSEVIVIRYIETGSHVRVGKASS